MNDHKPPGGNGRGPLPPIKFEALADALLGRIDSLVGQWLPDGKMQGNEYFVHSFWRSEKTASLSICMKGAKAGCWQDHGGEHKGGDLLSLYAAIHGMNNGAAAVELARNLGLEDVAGVMRAKPDANQPARPAPVPAPVADNATKPHRDDEGWATVAPIPEHAPAATFWHPYRKAEDITHTAAYWINDALYGYVVRFKKSDGGKETLPYTWCTSARDGTSAWKWKTWDEPRPLYFPAGKSPKGQTVVLVEGERKADVLQALLDVGAPGVYVVCGWVGGSKAWKKASWHWLAGCTVMAWPDCDGKREQLPKSTQESVTAQALSQLEAIGGTITDADRALVVETALDLARNQMPLLPEHKQVGMVAMLGIGTMLHDTQGCTVQLLPIPAPGTVADGWDCADAIEVDGWDFDRVLSFFGQAIPLSPTKAGEAEKIDGPVGTGGQVIAFPAPAKKEKAAKPEPELERDGAGNFMVGRYAIPGWLIHYYDRINKRWLASRKMVIAILENDLTLCDVLAYNELSNNVQARVPWPWPHSKAGNVTNAVDLLLGKYLTDTYGLPSIARAALQEAIQTVAHTRRFHPIREYLAGLEWDGKTRLGKWLIQVLGERPVVWMDADGNEQQPTINKAMAEYLEVVGRCWLLGMVNRVMEPGCKFDYCPVLEGAGGLRKSTMVEALAGAGFYSDTPFEVGRGKEAQEQVQGLWVYEIAEMTHFSKAEVGAIKAFISSKMDRYREAYGQTLSEFPRQCVLVGTTNENTYLRDRTGNRRFWPIPVRNRINTEWLIKYRDQLLAEAFVLYQQGAVYVPTQDQEDRLFKPMQESRLVETAVQGELLAVLTRAPLPTGIGAVVNDLTDFVTVAQLCLALGVDAAKSSPALEAQIRGWLDHQGWDKVKKQINGVRANGYMRPRNWPTQEDTQEMQASVPDTPAAPAQGAVPPVASDTDGYDAPF
jgi:hypothetical protein